MNEEHTDRVETSGAEQSRSETRQTWEEVGRQFNQLGQSLATAFSALWKSEETQQQLESLRDGLQALADEVSVALSKTASHSETQKVKAEVHKAAESARKATEKAAEEARPQIISALKQVNTELQKLIQSMESREEGD